MNFVEELFGLSGKTALVTGGSRGIGLAIAEGFVRAGARVYICSRDAAACAAAATQLGEFGTCRAIPGNIAKAEDRRHLLEELKRQESALDILVNNAGTLWAAPLAEYPESGWDKVYALNVKAVFFLIQALMPMLETAGTPADPARIINIGSANALSVPTHETYAYASSKAALHHLTRHLARRLASCSITANVIAPGRFPSKMLRTDGERAELESWTDPIPLKRLSAPMDLMGAALYLASKAGSYVTGAVLPIDGGMATTT